MLVSSVARLAPASRVSTASPAVGVAATSLRRPGRLHPGAAVRAPAMWTPAGGGAVAFRRLHASAPTARDADTSQPGAWSGNMEARLSEASDANVLFEERLRVWARRWEGLMEETTMRHLVRVAQSSLNLGTILRSEMYHNGKLLAPEAASCPARIESNRDFAQFMSFLDVGISQTHGLLPMGISLPVGKFVQTQVRLRGARRVLELGTLGGFSTLWLASGAAQPLHAAASATPAQVVTLELSQRHAEVAEANFDLARRLGADLAPIEIRLGLALDTLRAMPTPGADEAFDFVFIDADNDNKPAYYREIKRLVHPGSVLMIDNMGWQGKLADPSVPDSDCGGQRKLLDLIAADGLDAFTIHTANSKGGVDGFTMAVFRVSTAP